MLFNNFKKGPKYKIGQKVWCIESSTVKEVTVTACAFIGDSFRYDFNENRDSMTVNFYHASQEEKLFPSKEELIASL